MDDANDQNASQQKAEYLVPGTRVGFYEVIRLEGAGGFGHVYRVKRDGALYALKFGRGRLSDESPEDRQALEERFFREVGTLMTLSHPNIVRVHGVDRWPDKDGYQYFVMDFVEGAPLHEWVAKAHPSPRMVLGAFKKLGLALEEMHRLEVFHRDLKSDNVLIRTKAQRAEPIAEPVAAPIAEPIAEPIIVDFGLARPRSAYTLTASAVMVGTVSHYAPEYAAYLESSDFLDGKARFAWRPTTDLYALGVMLYKALTGVSPHHVQDDRELNGSEARRKLEKDLRDAIQSQTPRAPSLQTPTLPGAVDALVLRLLEKKPQDRFQRGKELADAIDELLSRATTEDPATGDPAWDAPLRKAGAKPADGGTQNERGGQAAAAAVKAAPLDAKPAGADAQPFPDRSVVEKARAEQAGAATFVPPTEAGFVAPDAGPSTARPSTASLSKDEALNAVMRKVQGVTRSAGRQRRTAAWFGLGTVVVLGAALAMVAAQNPRAPKPQDLLDTASRAERSPVSPASPTPQSADMSDDGVVRSVPLEVPAVPGLGIREPSIREPAIQESAIHESGAKSAASGGGAQGKAAGSSGLRATKGSAQSGAGPNGASSASASEAQASPFAPVRKLYASADPAAKTALGIPTGTHILVRLKSNLDSQTVGGGPMEARLERAFWLRDELKLPAKTMFFGEASATGGRFHVRVTRLVLPDGKELPLKALAYDAHDRKPGLAPSRMTTVTPPKGDGVAERVGKGAANIALAALPADTPGQIARQAGQAALQGERSAGATETAALFLDAGADFDLFVQEAL